ncbi:uncharacterized protein EV420DRAFT_1476478 [Desarmillaria tabescens]|uniref:Secreted protein n=1 Tax=Armillaria tabescens TaxID=1929756 RepID=A0AA39NDT9_ARMTA|nr:uncharacterized protein EV420DRAFT_1476478 [Desarmillaria tabescens]KAK0463818.1 hypothetical protein EV420DRAFT_1476478 [Desarmillaria tabescens]
MKLNIILSVYIHLLAASAALICEYCFCFEDAANIGLPILTTKGACDSFQTLTGCETKLVLCLDGIASEKNATDIQFSGQRERSKTSIDTVFGRSGFPHERGGERPKIQAVMNQVPTLVCVSLKSRFGRHILVDVLEGKR